MRPRELRWLPPRANRRAPSQCATWVPCWLGGRHAAPPPLPSSENLVTLGVVVPRGADREFQSTYESLSDYVVPRSATVLAEDGDYLLYGVTLFRRTSDAFRTAARGARVSSA